jgi:asparagine synthase (glutamine-hydrolysing)
MHGIEARERVRQLFRVSINGFAGDLVLGASFLHEASCLDKVTPRYVAGVMGCDPDLLTDLVSYRSLGKCDYYFIDNRVRRFTLMGPVHLMTVIHDRQPFLDNDLLELVYSLPDRERFRNRLYSRMLLRTFPAYFRTIPWQKTGVPISYPQALQRGVPALRRRLRALVPPAVVGRFRMLAPDGYTDYPSWLRAEPAWSLSSTLLCDDDAAHLEFVPRGTAPRLLEEHWTGLDHAEAIGRLLTLEIWLRQALRGQLRSGVSRP